MGGSLALLALSGSLISSMRIEGKWVDEKEKKEKSCRRKSVQRAFTRQNSSLPATRGCADRTFLYQVLRNTVKMC